MRTRKNQFNVEWNYAKLLWLTRSLGIPDPPAPYYSVWEVEENTGKEKLVKQIPCNVMIVRFR